jgi:uncharacterized tellurite resistance protein B-like protein
MNKELNEFQSSFTAEQKAAIFGCLVTIAKCDGEVHPKEYASVEQSSNVIGLDLVTDLAIIKQTTQNGLDGMIPVLNTLSKSQKEWYITSQHMVLHADGKVAPQEVNCCLEIAEKIGISTEEYKEILDRMDAIFDAFLSK